MSDNTDNLTDRLRRSAGTDAGAPELSPDLVASASSRRAPRLVNHGRTTRLASASLAAVAAVAVGSLVIVNPFAPSAPLFTAAAGAPNASALGGSEAALAADDARMAIWIDYDYVAGPDLGTDGGNGGVYQLRRIGSPEQVLADLAEQFGVDGEVVESSYFDPAYPTYVIGPEDGTAPSITVTWTGTGNWWFNNPAAYPPPVCELVSYETDAGTEEYEECTVPEIPASESLAPSEADAQGLAAEIFGELGLDVDADDVRVIADPWQTMATVNLVVDGIATAIDYSIAWSPLGEIAWAYGHSIEVVERGTFDTVSPTAAVERLDDWRWFGAGGPDYQGGMSFLADSAGVARSADDSVSSEPSEGGAVEPVDPTDTVEPGEPSEPVEPGEEPGVEPTEPIVEPTDEPTVEPTIEPIPEPETVTVTVESSEPTLLLMWDADGNAWLVPGYAMQHPDGFWNTIVSLVEGVIELPAPFDGEVVPFLED